VRGGGEERSCVLVGDERERGECSPTRGFTVRPSFNKALQYAPTMFVHMFRCSHSSHSLVCSSFCPVNLDLVLAHYRHQQENIFRVRKHSRP
jgi:hypothetical protein